MDAKKNNLKTIIISCVILAVLVAAFLIVYNIFSEKPVAGQKTITVQVVLADKTSKSYDIKTTSEFLRGALEEKNLVAGTESEYGLFVLTVDGVTADDTKQEWWNFTKNGETLLTGIDTTPILDGDHFEITLTVGY
jgi:uncharacterized protein YpmB